MPYKSKQKKEEQTILIDSILCGHLSSPYTPSSLIYQRTQTGLFKMSIEELDSLRTMIIFSK